MWLPATSTAVAQLTIHRQCFYRAISPPEPNGVFPCFSHPMPHRHHLGLTERLRRPNRDPCGDHVVMTRACFHCEAYRTLRCCILAVLPPGVTLCIEMKSKQHGMAQWIQPEMALLACLLFVLALGEPPWVSSLLTLPPGRVTFPWFTRVRHIAFV